MREKSFFFLYQLIPNVIIQYAVNEYFLKIHHNLERTCMSKTWIIIPSFYANFMLEQSHKSKYKLFFVYSWKFVFLIKNILFDSWGDNGRQEDTCSTHWFTPQLPGTAKLCQANTIPRTSSGSPRWLARSQSHTHHPFCPRVHISR